MPSAQSELSPAERREQLKQVFAQAKGCVRCPELAATRKKVVFGAGNADAALMFVGEAPGASEDEQGVPFVGRAGKLLETAARRGWTTERRGVYCEHVEVQTPRQPRPAADRDRQLPGVPAPPGRVDPTDRHLHARQLLHEAAARRPDGDHAPARPGRGARRSVAAQCGCIRSSIRPRRSTRLACSRRCARISPSCRSCSRRVRPSSRPELADEAEIAQALGGPEHRDEAPEPTPAAEAAEGAAGPESEADQLGLF